MYHAFCAVGWCHLGWCEAKNDERHLQWSYPVELSITLIWTNPLRNEEPWRVLSHASILDSLLLRLVEKTQPRQKLTGNQLLSPPWAKQGLHWEQWGEVGRSGLCFAGELWGGWRKVVLLGSLLCLWLGSCMMVWRSNSHALWWIIRYEVDSRPGIQGDFSLT